MINDTSTESLILKFEFTNEEINLILSGLGELPAKFSYGLLQKLHLIAGKQLNENTEEAEEVSEETNVSKKS